MARLVMLLLRERDFLPHVGESRKKRVHQASIQFSRVKNRSVKMADRVHYTAAMPFIRSFSRLAQFVFIRDSEKRLLENYNIRTNIIFSSLLYL